MLTAKFATGGQGVTNSGNTILINAFALLSDGTPPVSARCRRRPARRALSTLSGYTGQAWLAELGLYYYKNRLYSPSLGRFLQTDPIGYGDGMNMYAYVGNDPVNFTDPLGLTSHDLVGPPILVVGDRCRSGWTCYSPGDFSSRFGDPGQPGGYREPSGPDITVVCDAACRARNRPIVVTARRMRPPSFLFLAAAPQGGQDWCGSGRVNVPDGN